MHVLFLLIFTTVLWSGCYVYHNFTDEKTEVQPTQKLVIGCGSSLGSMATKPISYTMHLLDIPPPSPSVLPRSEKYDEAGHAPYVFSSCSYPNCPFTSQLWGEEECRTPGTLFFTIYLALQNPWDGSSCCTEMSGWLCAVTWLGKSLCMIMITVLNWTIQICQYSTILMSNNIIFTRLILVRVRDRIALIRLVTSW